MFSEEGVRLWSLICAFSTTLGASCISFNPTTGTFSSSPWLRFKCRVYGMVVISQVIFSIGRTIQLQRGGDKDLLVFNLCVAAILIFSIQVVACLILMLQPKEVAESVNFVYTYAMDLKRNWWVNYDSKTVLTGVRLQRATRFVIFCGFVNHFNGSMLSYIMADLPIFYLSLVDKASPHYPLAFLLHLAYCGGLLVLSSSILTFLVVIILGYFALIWPLQMNEFNAGTGRVKKKYSTLPLFRSVQHLPIEYRKFELLHRFSMNIFGLYILPFHSVTMNFLLYMNFILIRHSQVLDGFSKFVVVVLFLAMLIFWWSVLSIGGRFYKQSKSNHKSWKNVETKGREEAKYLSKFRKSIRPLVIGYEGVYVIKPLSVVKFFQGLIRGLFRTLLAVSKK